ncbi:MAG: VOC family protein [Vicinamibacterales bacterium]
MPAYHPGSFCWFELATTDHAGAKRFYGDLFGWTSEDAAMGPTGAYTTFKMNGREVAAAYPMIAEQAAQGIPSNWLPYVAVETADECVARTTALGGQVHMPGTDVADLGRMAVLADPTGAVFAIWQAKSQPGAEFASGFGAPCWVELSSPDPDRAADFYGRLFAWRMSEGRSENPAKPGEYIHISCNDRYVGGMIPKLTREPGAPPHWLTYFSVESCERSTAKAFSLGGRPFVDTMQIGDEGRISVIGDPQGAVFALHQK